MKTETNLNSKQNKNKTPVRIGTSYFDSFYSAVRYYAAQHETAQDVTRKLEEKLIHIGLPPVKKGERVLLSHSEGRYFIES